MTFSGHGLGLQGQLEIFIVSSYSLWLIINSYLWSNVYAFKGREIMIKAYNMSQKSLKLDDCMPCCYSNYG